MTMKVGTATETV